MPLKAKLYYSGPDELSAPGENLDPDSQGSRWAPCTRLTGNEEQVQFHATLGLQLSAELQSQWPGDGAGSEEAKEQDKCHNAPTSSNGSS